MIFASVLFSVILIAGFTISSYADYTSPKKQIESGIVINDIQCRDDRVLVQRSNGSPACVSERTAERTGWEILKTEFIHTEKLVTIHEPTITPDQVTPTIVILDQSSDVEFVDDGRELWVAKAGGISSPRDIYQYVIGKQMKHSEFKNDGEGNITLTSVPHEKYSLKPNKTLYLEDWLPDYVPDGYKLLYSQTDWSEKARETTLVHQYVPVSFELTEDTNLWHLQTSKGFNVGVVMSLDKKPSIESSKIKYLEMDGKFRKNTFKFQDVERDGKEVFAYSGGNSHLSYHATVMFHPDKYTSVVVGSYYHTIDELLPIFNSVMK